MKFSIKYWGLLFTIASLSPFGNFLVSFKLYITFCALFLLLLNYFKLPLPNTQNVDTIFGPCQLPRKQNPRHENECHCHFQDNRKLNCSFKDRIVSSANSVNQFDPSFSVIGHRGAGMNAPENSLAAIRKCASRGCTMVEFDVSLTKDSVPVLFHDDNLLRVMGVDKKISEISWDDLRKINISEDFPGEKVPTVEEAVQTCLELGVRFIIDIKEENETLLNTIVSLFQKYGERAYSSGVVSSFYFRAIYKIRARDPQIVGCMAWRPASFAVPLLSTSRNSSCAKILETVASKVVAPLIYCVNDFAMNYLYWWIIGLSALLVHKDALNIELVDRLHSRGLRVFAWTVNCSVEKQYFINKLKIGYLTDTLLDTQSEGCCINVTQMPLPENLLSNNNN